MLGVAFANAFEKILNIRIHLVSVLSSQLIYTDYLCDRFTLIFVFRFYKSHFLVKNRVLALVFISTATGSGDNRKNDKKNS